MMSDLGLGSRAGPRGASGARPAGVFRLKLSLQPGDCGGADGAGALLEAAGWTVTVVASSTQAAGTYLTQLVFSVVLVS